MIEAAELWVKGKIESPQSSVLSRQSSVVSRLSQPFEAIAPTAEDCRLMTDD